MNEQPETFTQRYKRIKKDIENHPDYRRNNYARKLRGILIIPFTFIALILAYFLNLYLGISEYITCSIAGVIAIVSSFIFSKKIADKKFKKN